MERVMAIKKQIPDAKIEKRTANLPDTNDLNNYIFLTSSSRQ